MLSVSYFEKALPLRPHPLPPQGGGKEDSGAYMIHPGFNLSGVNHVMQGPFPHPPPLSTAAPPSQDGGFNPELWVLGREATKHP